MARRNYSNTSVATTLNGAILSGDLSLVVTSASGYPTAPFVIVIDPDTASEELILVGTKASTTFSSLTRGIDGTSASGHPNGAVIKHVVSATDIDEVNAHRWSQPAISNDTDNALTAIHHTLGTGALQAAAGDHGHAGGPTAGIAIQLATSSTDQSLPYNVETTTATFTVTLPSGWLTMDYGVMGSVWFRGSGSNDSFRGQSRLKFNGTQYSEHSLWSFDDSAFSIKGVTVPLAGGEMNVSASRTMTTTATRLDSVSGLTLVQTACSFVIVKVKLT